MQIATSILTLLKATLFVLAGFVLAMAGFTHRAALGEAIEELPSLIGRMATMKVAGVEIGFNHGSFDLSVDRNLPTAERRRVLEAIKDIGPDSFVRLFYVDGQNFCEYERPTMEVRRTVQAHFELAALGLVDLTALQKTLGRHAEFGDANKCYAMKLTTLGWRVKTALLTSISRAFRERPPAA